MEQSKIIDTLETYQMSKQSFLDGFREERLYVIQPEGFVDPKDAKTYAISSDSSMD